MACFIVFFCKDDSSVVINVFSFAENHIGPVLFSCSKNTAIYYVTAIYMSPNATVSIKEGHLFNFVPPNKLLNYRNGLKTSEVLVW